MAILALPTEVLINIIRTLDTESICKLYETCKFFRDLIRTPAVVKKCQFTLNTLATVKSFNLVFFRDISGHLQALNLCGVHDLNKSTLISVLKILKNLTNLDVTFTSITLPDYLEFVELVPKLKSLAINFYFCENYKIDKDALLAYQQAFSGLKNVHFVGSSTDLVSEKLAGTMLRKADLLNFKFTICMLNHSFKTVEFDNSICDDMTILKLKQFQVYFIEEIFDYPLSEKSGIFKMMDLKSYEIVLFQTCYKSVFATKLLQESIYKHFQVDVQSLRFAHGMIGQAVLLFWDKEQTKFDSEFYSKLMLCLQEYLVYNFEFTDRTNLPVPMNYKWYHVEQLSPGYDMSDSHDEFLAKRARLAGTTFAINFDPAFVTKKDNFKLKITFSTSNRLVSLQNCQSLSKITHLILNGDCQLAVSFYNNLFSFCTSLVTLEITRQRGMVATPLKQLYKSKSMKNILLHIRGSCVDPIYTHLSQCNTLENIILVNKTLRRMREVEALPDPTQLFRQCERLYNICLETFFYEREDRDWQMGIYAAVRSRLGKEGLNIDIVRFSDTTFGERYNPYMSVFDVYRLRPT